MNTIFETKRLRVRKLKLNDFEPFHTMQSNLNVMQYVRGRAMTYQENKKELPILISKYDKVDNDFWIYAIERKQDNTFVGTLALVKDANNDDEIGYRFLEKYWRQGYGNEIVKGLIVYCKKVGFTKLIACVVTKNTASANIIKNNGFQFVEDFISDDLKVPEKKFELLL
ncbi:MAG TPA: N-acetyltransferase [Flavobacteriia bacterium]|nr:N-acetyltransferase [Flavobacteriia bacterium]